jgi:hypothetical protein
LAANVISFCYTLKKEIMLYEKSYTLCKKRGLDNR